MRVKVSVAMATYNGEKYIKEQIDSILVNLDKNDELIISDDGSTDNTINIIKSYNDERINLIDGPHKGIKQNFANAISHTTGKYIFLSDQDDIWMNNKVEKIIEIFDKKQAKLIVHDAIVFDSATNKVIYDSFFKHRNSGSGVIKNIIKNTYIGCCMAFDRDLKKYILPIPDDIEMHDQWIGILNDKYYDDTIFLNEKLIKYRRHNNNASELKHYDLKTMIKNRIQFIKELKTKERNETK